METEAARLPNGISCISDNLCNTAHCFVDFQPSSYSKWLTTYGLVTSDKTEVSRPVRFVRHSFVLSVIYLLFLSMSRIIAKVMSQFQWANELKLGVVIWLTNHKNWLTFGGDTVPHTDSGSLFHFPHHCRKGILADMLAFFIQSPANFHNTPWNDWCWHGNESRTFRKRSDRHPDPNLD